MSDPTHIVVSDNDSGMRLDVFLVKTIADLSRKKAADLIDEGKVLVDGRKGRMSSSVQAVTDFLLHGILA